MASNNQCESIWGYRPNRVAPVIYAALFTASGCWHVWQAQHYKSWKMTMLLPVGCLFYTAGLACREASSFFPENDGIFISTRVLILDATAIAAAANYFILGRTLYYNPWASPLDPRRATQIFIFLDWLVGILVAVGLSHVYKDGERNVSVGNGFVRASLLLQIVLYTFYLAVLGIWHRRSAAAKVQRPLARSYLVALYACGVLVLVRTIYRTIEYFQGATGYLALHEAYYYVFDALTILVMVGLLNVSHPGKFFSEDSSVYLAIDGMTERKGPGWSDGRRWWWAVIDPVGIVEYVNAENGKTKFWEERQKSEGQGSAGTRMRDFTPSA